MVHRKLSIIDEIKVWFSFNQNVILCIFTVIIFGFCYWFFAKNDRNIDLESYTNEVQLIHLDYEKSYSLPGLYSTKQKLDKILFDLEYLHNNIKLNSKAVLYWEYVTPNLERILDNKEFDRLIVKCKNNSPEKAMIFIKKE